MPGGSETKYGEGLGRSRREQIASIGGDAVLEVSDAISSRVAAGQPIRWSQLFELGVAEIDREHAALFEHLNGLSARINSPEDQRLLLVSAFDDFRIALQAHFEHEEAIFHSLAPVLEEAHGEGHQHFSEGVARMASAMTGEDHETARRALALLAALFVQHILVDDKQFIGAVRGL